MSKLLPEIRIGADPHPSKHFFRSDLTFLKTRTVGLELRGLVIVLGLLRRLPRAASGEQSMLSGIGGGVVDTLKKSACTLTCSGEHAEVVEQLESSWTKLS